MKKGEVVLITFPFTDLSSSKLRPAVVLAEETHSVIVAFISSNIKRFSTYDIELIPSKDNGLKKESLIKTNKIATLDKKLLLGKIGNLSDDIMKQIDKKLTELFRLK